MIVALIFKDCKRFYSQRKPKMYTLVNSNYICPCFKPNIRNNTDKPLSILY